MCLNSTCSSNMSMTFHEYGSNPRLLECDVLLWYNGMLPEFVVLQPNLSCFAFILCDCIFVTAPRALVVIVNPTLSGKLLGGGSTPILTLARPFMMLYDNFNLIKQPIVANGTDTTR